MATDLLLRNGTIVDGSGAPAFQGDVAISAGRIEALGKPGQVGRGATQVIDADDLVVCPGFIDFHTHYDAQVCWDPLCTPSADHGVTSVLIGNCGYSLAPVRAQDREYVMGLFSTVEQVSKHTLEKGIPWNWESQAEYLDWLEQRGLGINIAAQVGHSAIRRFVMGESAHEREATVEEIAAMQNCLRRGMQAGAIGFSTSRVGHQRGENGEPIPSFMASEEELFALAAVLGELGRGILGINPRSKAQEFNQEDRDQLVRLAEITGGMVNWNEFNQRSEYPDQWRSLLDFMEGAQSNGNNVYGVMRCQRMDLNFNLRETRVFDGNAAWREFIALPHEQKLARLWDDESRVALARELENGFPGARDWFRRIGVAGARLEENQALNGRLFSDLAKEGGMEANQIFLKLAAQEELATEFAFFGVSNGDEEAVAEMLASPATLVGISDAGAHVHTFTGVDYPTHFLSHWVREKQLITLEEGIRMLSSQPAKLAGLRDRGELRPGAAADLCLFDLETIGPRPLEVWHDLPGGDSRQVKQADGVEWVIVNGQVLLEQGEPTGELPGQVLRAT